jgi:hypothetical protein
MSSVYLSENTARPFHPRPHSLNEEAVHAVTKMLSVYCRQHTKHITYSAANCSWVWGAGVGRGGVGSLIAPVKNASRRTFFVKYV